MTLEQREYGAGWTKCTRCGVHNAAATFNALQLCIDVDQCTRWRVELAEKKRDPIRQLRVRGVADLELEYNHRKSTK